MRGQRGSRDCTASAGKLTQPVASKSVSDAQNSSGAVSCSKFARESVRSASEETRGACRRSASCSSILCSIGHRTSNSVSSPHPLKRSTHSVALTTVARASLSSEQSSSRSRGQHGTIRPSTSSVTSEHLETSSVCRCEQVGIALASVSSDAVGSRHPASDN